MFDGMYEFCQLSAGGSLGEFWGDRLYKRTVNIRAGIVLGLKHRVTEKVD